MMNYKTLSIFAINLMFCSTTYAFTLGKIQVSSEFREPLKAQIPVATALTGESGPLRVSLAQNYAYLNAGINRSPIIDRLNLALTKDKLGNYIINISSKEPVNELFLELILDVGTDSQRLSREYAVLFDPAGYKVPRQNRSTEVSTLSRKVKAKPVEIKPSNTDSHDMKGSVEESHSMESSIGEDSHDMKGSVEESHSMESSIGEDSHDMKGSVEESHSMESSIGEDSHDMEGSVY